MDGALALDSSATLWAVTYRIVEATAGHSDPARVWRPSDAAGTTALTGSGNDSHRSDRTSVELGVVSSTVETSAPTAQAAWAQAVRWVREHEPAFGPGCLIEVVATVEVDRLDPTFSR